MPTGPVIAVHAGAGPASPAAHLQDEARQALIAALQRGRDALTQGGAALDAVQAAVAYMRMRSRSSTPAGARCCAPTAPSSCRRA